MRGCPLNSPVPVEDGARLLDDIEAFLSRFIAYPGQAELVAHVLWVVHTWLMERWESTPRLAFLSPEPGSGKSRALEVTHPLVPRAVHAVNVTPAYLFRKVAQEDGRPTILYDEIDTVFGPGSRGNEDVRGMLNAGHRKGATAGRCVARGSEISTEELDAYAAVAMAGLGNLPDTIRSRSIIVRMRRRSGDEKVEPWRARVNEPEAAALAERLARWSAAAPTLMRWPVMPDQVQDRDADVWEAPLAVADMAGGRWPERARVAAVTLVTRTSNDGESLGVTLLRDLRDLFQDEDRLSTQTILDSLIARVESPWGDLRGKQLTDRKLAQLLKPYGVSPKQMRIEGASLRGYDKGDLADPFDRYLQPAADPEASIELSPRRQEDSPTTATPATTATPGAATGNTDHDARSAATEEKSGAPAHINGPTTAPPEDHPEDTPPSPTIDPQWRGRHVAAHIDQLADSGSRPAHALRRLWTKHDIYMLRSAYLEHGAELGLSEAHMDRLADYKGLPSDVAGKNEGYPAGAVFYTSRPDTGASRK